MAANQILQTLLFNIESNTAQLKQSLDQSNSMFKGVGETVNKVGGYIKAAFALGAIISATEKVFAFSQEIGHATDQVKSLTGYVGKDLVDATAKALSIVSTFDLPLEGLLDAAKAVSNEFGISVPAALEKIKQSYALTGSEEIIENAKEYSAQFKSAGASVDDFFAIATRSINEGIYSDKGVDTIKEAGLRLREMTPATVDALKNISLSGAEIQKQIANGTLTTFGAIQLVGKKLQDFKDDSQQVGQALADVFGGPGEDAGIKFIKSLGDANAGFDTLVNNANDTVKAQLHLAAATEELDKTFVNFFGGSKTAFTELKAKGIDLIVSAINTVKRVTIDLINYFIDLYNNSILFRSIIQATVFYVKELFAVFKLGFTAVFDSVSSLGKIVKAVLTGNFGEIKNIIAESIRNGAESIKEFGTASADNFKTAFKAVMSKNPIKLIDENEAESQATKAVEKIKNVVNTVGKSIKVLQPPEKDDSFTLGAVPGEIIKKKPKGTGEPYGVKVKLEEYTGQIKQATSAWDGFGKAAEKNIGGIAVNSLSTLGDALGGLLTDQQSGFKSFVTTVLGGIRQIIQAFLQQAIAAQIAGNAKYGLPGLALAAVGIAAVTALFSSLKFENGVNDAPGGLALVGERGPEIVNIPRGSQVLTNRQSRDFINNGNNNIHVTIESKLVGQDIVQSVKEVTRRNKANV